VANGANVTEFEHYVARGFFRTNGRGGFTEPEVPYELLGSSASLRAPEPAPRLDEHGGHYRSAPRTPRPGPATQTTRGLPFEGLRVADFTANWAGPIIGHALAMFGGEVIHVESAQRPDPIRFNTIKELGDADWWEWSPLFHGPNTTKRGLTLDMSSEPGRELARELIRQSDILVENYSPRVVEGWGLDWDEVHRINPRAIMVRAPAFGITGPWRDRTGYAQTMEMASGLAWMTGWAESPPEIPNGPMDPIAGTHATIALLLALEHRRRTGEGMLVEAPMVRGALSVAAQQVVEYSAYGALLSRDGNRDATNAPQGVYRTADPLPDGKLDRWVMISVDNDDQWKRLCAALDDPDLATNDVLATAAGRRSAHDEIDDRLAKWCAGQTSDDVVSALVSAGVPAAKVLLQNEPREVEHLVARNFWETVEHPVTGVNLFPRYPVRLGSQPGQLNRSPAPRLGENNREVLVDVLGLTDADVDQLEADGVIGSVPGSGGHAW
jgi:crotonobetainyl-CoA:carnitine CoA-transferase CaiB-like acyl-CoA transferase